MATYEYTCRECEVAKTISRGISDPDPGYFCQVCGNRMNRVYSMANPVFNGSGFYSKDK